MRTLRADTFCIKQDLVYIIFLLMSYLDISKMLIKFNNKYILKMSYSEL